MTKKEIIKLIEDSYRGKYGAFNLPQILFEHTSKRLIEAVKKGWGGDISAVHSPDYDLYKKFEKNVFFFAANKTAQQLNDYNNLMIGPDGKRRNKAEFAKAALKIDRKYNTNWLDTEYNTTLRIARAGREFKEFHETKDLYPYLEFEAVGDENTRKAHDKLNGIIRKVTDPFWNKYTPPLEWNCRCRLKRRKSGRATNLKGRKLPEVHPLFEENAYNSKRIWNLKNHPYSKILPGQRREVNELVEKKIKPKFPELMPDAIKDFPVKLDYRIFKLLKEKTKFHQPPNDGAFCTGFGKEVTISLDSRWKRSDVYKKQVTYHEFGHAVHGQHRIITHLGHWDDNFADLFDNLQYKLKGPRRSKKNPNPKNPAADLHNRLNHIENMAWISGEIPDYLKAYGHRDILEFTGAVADTLEALTNSRFGWGHGKSYFSSKWKRGAEVFAHVSEIGFMENPVFTHDAPELLELMKEYFNKHVLTLMKDE